MADTSRDDLAAVPASAAGAVDLSALSAQQQAAAPASAAANAADTADGQRIPLVDVVIDGAETELEQFAQLSTLMPVIVQMYASWSHESVELKTVLEQVVRSVNGRTALLRIDLDANPQLGRQPQAIALFGGQPMPLFTGNPPREQIEQLLGELLQAAAQRGMTATVAVGEEPAAAPEPELPPLHREAQDAIARGDVAAAKRAFEQALAEQPGDDAAKAGLAQMNLLTRLQGKALPEIRERAAENPGDLDAQLDVADLDLSGGHVGDACNRLLGLYPKADADGKTRLRERLLEYFEVVGGDDNRIKRARQQLTSLLFA